MEIISDIEKVKKGCILTIGNFDGVHIGHREILKVARETAAQKSAELVAMTFQPHPAAILYPEKAPGVLTPLEVKEKLLAQFGVDKLIVVAGGLDFLQLEPLSFLKKFLVKNIHPAVVVEGDDFNFGAKRAGNINTLCKFGDEKSFEVILVEAKKATLSASGQTVKVSSTMIRYMLTSGNVTDTADCLGRAYKLVGKIIKGKGIGQKLGFPTLNLEKPNQIIPAEGVYAGMVKVSETLEQVCEANCDIPAVFSIGQARTFGNQHPLLIEAHLLIKDADEIIGKWMAMDFVEYIRKQHKFTTPEELSAQIAKDCQKAKNILVLCRNPTGVNP
ncbi:Bifunctional riboflavin kinase/FMN adenylyltransferase [subsurface metagenome]